MFQDETDENVVEGVRPIRQVENVGLFKLNIGQACRHCLSPGFGDGSFGYVDGSDQGVRAVPGQGGGLRADTATGFQNAASRRIAGVRVQQLHQGGGLILQTRVFPMVVARGSISTQYVCADTFPIASHQQKFAFPFAPSLGTLALHMTETLRAWTEAVETFVLEVISEERPGKRAALARSCLYALSQGFLLGVKVRRFLYQVRILRDSTLGIQVIAIGNLTVGGTGKTPVVEKFARELQKQGRTVAILSRGYRSKPQPFAQWLLNSVLFRSDTTPPRVVSDGKSLLLDSDTAGRRALHARLQPQGRGRAGGQRTASRAGATPSRISAATRFCWTMDFNTGGWPGAARTLC
jgi:hypothetical protein